MSYETKSILQIKSNMYMEFFSTIVIGWQWLKIGVNAKQALVTGNTEFGTEFYESKLHTLKFYFKYEMPKTLGCAEILLNDEALTIAEERELIA